MSKKNYMIYPSATYLLPKPTIGIRLVSFVLAYRIEHFHFDSLGLTEVSGNLQIT